MQPLGSTPAPVPAAVPAAGGAAAQAGTAALPAAQSLQLAEPMPPGCTRAALLNRKNLAELFVRRSEVPALRQLELTLRGERCRPTSSAERD